MQIQYMIYLRKYTHIKYAQITTYAKIIEMSEHYSVCLRQCENYTDKFIRRLYLSVNHRFTEYSSFMLKPYKKHQIP